MGTAVEDVHHRYGQHVRLKSAEEAIERNILGLCRRIRCRNRHRENRVRAELGLILRAVHIKHRLIDRIDVTCLDADECRRNLRVYILDRLRDALAAELRLVAVAQLKSLKLTRGGTRRRSAAADRTILENDLRLNRRIAARVNDLTTDNLSDS